MAIRDVSAMFDAQTAWQALCGTREVEMAVKKL